MRIVAGRTKAACGIVFIKYGVHSLGDKGYVRYWQILLQKSVASFFGR
jgi:hypothetical protein